MSKNLIARIAVAVVAIPVILLICYQGGSWLFGMVLLFAIMALSEFLINEGFKPAGWPFWLAMLTLLVSYGLLTGYKLPGISFLDQSLSAGAEGGLYSLLLFMPLIIFFLVTAMLFSLGKTPPSELFRKHSRLIWGVAYVTLLYPFVFRVGVGSGDISGGDSLLFLFGVLWVGDTAAMGIGQWLGKHKLAPTVSPNKTIEGFFGGLTGAIVIGVVMYFWKLQALGLYHVVVIAVGCSIFGQLGDLVESMWKRSLEIKDSSNIIPGHGGVLDRFDSLLFAAPFMYGYLNLIQ